jgi:endonuclease-3
MAALRAAKSSDLPVLPVLLDRLGKRYEPLPRPVPRKALDWVLWENAAYLVPDERRAAAYRALAKATGLSAEGILGRPHEELRAIAALGGMHPGGRVAKWIAIAETVRDAFGGDLEAVLGRPLAEARRALKTFPGIGAPGADKILLFTRTHALVALESNGLRVLVRLGIAKEGKSYAASYRDAVRSLEPFVERGSVWLIRAHELLRVHGQTLCKRNGPACDRCPLDEVCPSAE